MNILKAIAVNILAVIALPFLFIGTVFKLCSKALEKIAFIFITLVVLVGIYFIHDMIYSGDEAIAMVIVTLIFLGLIVLFLINIFLFASTVCLALVNFISVVLEALNGAAMFLFNLLMKTCEKLRDSMPYGKAARIICLLETIVLAIRWVILHLFVLAFPLACILSILLVLGSPIYANILLKNIIGINLIQYLKLFSGRAVFFTILYLLVSLASAVIILLCLGIEWTEWAIEELDQSDADSSEPTVAEPVIIVANPQQSIQNSVDTGQTIYISSDSL